jgi:acyl carrier protein
MTTEEIRNGVDEVLKRFMRKMPGDTQINADASLRDELNIDSADMIEIALELEERFEIAVPEDAINQIKTLRHVVQLVERIVSARRPLAEQNS